MNETIAKSIVFLSGGVEQYDELRKNGSFSVDGVTHIYDKERNIYATATNDAGVNELLEKVYPIGSIYMSIVDNSPQNFLGGTWERIEDKFLLSAGTSYMAGSEGGSAEHTLTIDEMPSHKHQLESGVGVDWSDQGATTSPISFLPEISNGRNIESKAVGGGLPHNNMPPYLAVYMWKRTA